MDLLGLFVTYIDCAVDLHRYIFKKVACSTAVTYKAYLPNCNPSYLFTYAL